MTLLELEAEVRLYDLVTEDALVNLEDVDDVDDDVLTLEGLTHSAW